MSKEELKEKFIEKSRARFGDIFDYSKVEYIDAHTKVCLIKNGISFSVTPDSHLHTKYGGAAFNPRKKSFNETMTFEEFVKFANEKYNSRYTYECKEWKGLVKSEVFLFCPIHGKQQINARSHISMINKNGCPVCADIQRHKSNTHSYQRCIEEFKKIYGDKYIYPEENEKTYVNKQSKIKIICPEHGEFQKTAQKHLSGQGCPKCKMEYLKQMDMLPGGYNEQLFIDKPFLKNKKAYLYYLETEDGTLFKIGITSVSVKNRINGLKQKAKEFGEEIVLKEISSKEYSLYDAFIIEQKILNENKEKRVYKKWSTELFNENIFDDIKQYFS